MEVKIVPMTLHNITFTITAKDADEKLLFKLLKEDKVSALRLRYFAKDDEHLDEIVKVVLTIPNKIKNQWYKQCEPKKEEAPNGSEGQE